VLADIAKTLYSEDYIANLFHPQDLCSLSEVRAVFEKISHSSMMRLNKQSMDKVMCLPAW